MSMSEIHHPVLASFVMGKLQCTAAEGRLQAGILVPETVSNIDVGGWPSTVLSSLRPPDSLPSSFAERAPNGRD